jgi:hypothetical protein
LQCAENPPKCIMMLCERQNVFHKAMVKRALIKFF